MLSASFPLRVPPEQLYTAAPPLAYPDIQDSMSATLLPHPTTFPSHPITTYQLLPDPHPSATILPSQSHLNIPHTLPTFWEKKFIHPSFPLFDMLLRKPPDNFLASPFLQTIPGTLYTIVRIILDEPSLMNHP